MHITKDQMLLLRSLEKKPPSKFRKQKYKKYICISYGQKNLFRSEKCILCCGNIKEKEYIRKCGNVVWTYA